MSHEKLTSQLAVVLADTYTLYLKTQNYHWHVRGPNFYSYHNLFEGQYTELASAVDEIAERIITLGVKAPATFKEMLALTTLTEGDKELDAAAMIKDLAADQEKVKASLMQALTLAQEAGDEGSVALIGERIAHHEKMAWMLASSH